MKTPGSDPQDSPAPAATVSVDPVEVTPGLVVEVPVGIVNRTDRECTFAIEVTGLEEEWVEGPAVAGPLAPGQAGEALLRLRLPVGHPACRLVASVTARPAAHFYDQAEPTRPSRPATADLILVVGDGTLISAVLEPTEIRGAHRGHFDVVLHNRGAEPLRVDLYGSAVDPSVSLRFREPSPVLGAGEAVRVRTTVRGPRPVAGGRRRRPFGVRIQGRSTPVLLEGSFSQRPLISGWLIKGVAILAVVALWVTVAAVGITALDKRVRTSAAAKSVANAPPLPVSSIPSSHAALGHAKASIHSGSRAAVRPGSSAGPSVPATSAGGGSSNGGGRSSTGGGSAAGAGGAGGSGSAGGSGGSAAGAGGSGSDSGAGGGSASGAGGSGSASGAGGGSSGVKAAGVGGRSSGGKPAGVDGSGGKPAGGGSGGDPAATHPAGASGSAASTAGVVHGARVSGKVASSQPAGITVSIAPTSLVDENSQGANLTTSSNGAVEVAKISSSHDDTPIGKVYGTVAAATFNAGLSAATTPDQKTTTSPDGSWAFAGLRAPGDYLVTFSKDGYETSKYIVTTTTASSPVTLSAKLSPGSGSVAGTVDGPGGPLGDADITITDGTVTAATKTPTIGATGTWQVNGLSTPDTYLVTASAPGFGAQTTLVTLAAGGTQHDVVLTLQPGVGTITGTVTTARNGTGVGGVKVTATSGKTTLSATTTTVNPVGSYTLPNLPIPDTYTLTVSGPGWVSQTQQVLLKANQVVDATLTRNAGDVTGLATDSSGAGLAGAGAVLANDKNTFKTLTESAAPVGGFDFGQVPSGQYVLTIEDFGYTTTSADVTVVDGATETVNLALPFVGAATENTATIEGSVSDVVNATPIVGATLTLDGGTTVVATTNSSGTYQIPGVSPGVHSVTASAKGYESNTVRVSVSEGGLAFAPPNLLPIEDTVAGIVVSNTGGVVPDPSVTLVDPATNTTVAATTNPLSTPTLTGIPAPALGGFEIDDVPHGNYLLEISAPPANGCGTNAYVPTKISVDVALGTNLILTGTQSPALDLAPSFNVVTLAATPTSLPVQTGGVAVTLTDTATGAIITCTSPAPPTAVGTTPTDLTFPGLVDGDPYTASFSLTASDGTVITAPSISFTASLDNTTIDTVILSAAALPIDVTLQYLYRTLNATGVEEEIDCPVATSATAPCPALRSVDLPTITMTGTTGYNFPEPGQPGSPIQPTFTAQAPTNGGDIWTFPASVLSGLLPSSVTFKEADTDGTFRPYTKSDSTTDNGFNAQSLVLSLAPGATPASSITPAVGVSVSTSPALPDLTLSDENGTLVWNDSESSTPGSVEPGVYTLQFSDPGYDSQTRQVTIPFQGTPCVAGGCLAAPIPPVVLAQHVSLSVTPLFTPVTAGTASLAYPTVTLTDTSTNPPTNVAPPVNLSPTLSTATFSDLSLADPNYVLTVTAPGFATYTATVCGNTAAPPSPPTCGDTLVETPLLNTASPQLVPQGYLVGSVVGQINAATAPLAGVSVLATLLIPPVGGCPGQPTTLTPVVTQADGSFILTGDPTDAAGSAGGLCNGAFYLVTSAPNPLGYTNNGPFGSILVLVGPNGGPAVELGTSGTPTIVLTAVLVTEVIHVTNSVTGNPIAGAAVVAVSGVGVEIGTDPPTNPPPLTDNSGNVTLQIDPTTYTFTVTATGFSPNTPGPVPFSTTAPNAPTLDVELTPSSNEVSGTVTVHQSTGNGVPLDGIVVTLYTAATPSVAVATATTGSTDAPGTVTGSFSFTAETGGGAIPDGDYLLGANIPGYSYYEQPQVFPTAPASPTSTTADAVENLQFQADLVAVDIPVTSTVPGDSLIGADVTLKPITGSPPTGLSCGAGTSPLLAAGLGVEQDLTLEGPTVSFTNVVPDYYMLDVDGTGSGHQAQTAKPVEICPGGTTTIPFTVAEGQITGTVAAADNFDPSTSTVHIYSGASTPPAVPAGATPLSSPAVSCSSGTCSYSTFVPLGAAYTVSVSLAGFTTLLYSTPTLTAVGQTSAAFTSALVPDNHSVVVTVESAASPTLVAPTTATVTLALTSDQTDILYSATPGPAPGEFDFPDVAPNQTSTYTVTASFGLVQVSDAFQVQVSPTTGDPIRNTLAGQFGSIDGHVTAAGGNAAATLVRLYDGPTAPVPGSTPIATPAVTCPGGGACSYGVLVPLNDQYYVDASLPGFVDDDVSTGVLTAANGTPTVDLNLTPEPHQVDVTVESDTTPALPAPPDAAVTLAPAATPTQVAYIGVPGAAPGVFDFSGVAPGSYLASATFGAVTITNTVTVPAEPTSDDPVPGSIQKPFGAYSGTVVLNPLPAVTATVNIDVCTSATACATTGVLTGTAQVPPNNDPQGTYTLYLPPTGTTVSYFVVYSSTGYVTTTPPLAITVTDGTNTVVTAPVVLST